LAVAATGGTAWRVVRLVDPASMVSQSSHEGDD
jgi:hypothetical protein